MRLLFSEFVASAVDCEGSLSIKQHCHLKIHISATHPNTLLPCAYTCAMHTTAFCGQCLPLCDDVSAYALHIDFPSFTHNTFVVAPALPETYMGTNGCNIPFTFCVKTLVVYWSCEITCGKTSEATTECGFTFEQHATSDPESSCSSSMVACPWEQVK